MRRAGCYTGPYDGHDITAAQSCICAITNMCNGAEQCTCGRVSYKHMSFAVSFGFNNNMVVKCGWLCREDGV